MFRPSRVRGTATSSIQPAVSTAAATVWRPDSQRVSRRISGQEAKASTAAQNRAETKGASTQRLAPSRLSSRIWISRRSVLIADQPLLADRQSRGCITSAQQLDTQAVGLFGPKFQPSRPHALGNQYIAPGSGMGTRQGDPQGGIQTQGTHQQATPFRLRLAQPVQVQLAILAQLTQERGGAGQQLAQWRVGIQPLGMQVGAAIATGDH